MRGTAVHTPAARELRTPAARERRTPGSTESSAVSTPGVNASEHDAANVAALNDTLAPVPCHRLYDLEIAVGDRRFRVTGTPGSPLVISVPGAVSGAAPTRIRFATADALRRVASEGQAAAMALMARGMLSLTGDAAALQALGAEFAPHAIALEPLLHALAFGHGADKVVRWVPDAEAPACMACSRVFTLSRRRHHCRTCGEVCCARCAPRRLAPAGTTRICDRCVSSGAGGLPRRPAATPLAPATPLVLSPGSERGAAASRPAHDETSPSDLVLELMIESALARFRFRWECLRAASIALTCATLVLGLRYTSSGGRWGGASPGRLAVCAAALLLVLARNFVLRYYRIGWLCLVVALNSLVTTAATRGRAPPAQDALWELTRRTNARFVYDTVASLGGFWVKLAQSTSISSALPEVYKLELAKLQDAMPADSLDSVERLLARELGPRWREKVTLDRGPPLGSATIAQVHRARLRVTREGGAVDEVDGVVKVQHTHVEASLLIDIHASQLVAVLVSLAFPHLFHDLRSVVKDLSVLTRNELDFRLEATNQATAREALRASHLAASVLVPEVLPQLVTRRVLAMEFIDGFNIKELRGKGSSASAETVRAVVTKLVEAFSLTMHGEIFNCDPHPGNLLVERVTGRLVILDWGQARRLTPVERAAYTKIFMSVAMEDTMLLRQACAELGVPAADFAGKPDPTPNTMIGTFRFLLRDTKTQDAARGDFEAIEGTLKTLQLANSGVKLEGSVEEICKGALLPFTKTCNLIFEVASSLDVSLPLLQMLTLSGYAALLHAGGTGVHVDLAEQPTGPPRFVLHPARPLSALRAPTALSAACEAALVALHAQGRVLGAQLCVLDAATGEALCDLAIGHTSWLDPRPVSTETAFQIRDISKLFLAVAVLRLTEHAAVQKGSTLSIKSEVAAKGVTLEHVLSHTTGWIDHVPTCCNTFSELCDVAATPQKCAQLDPLLPVGFQQKFTPVSYGMLAARACELGGAPLAGAWAEMAEAALPGRGAARLSLTAPASPREIAEPWAKLRNPTIADFAADMEELTAFVTSVAAGDKPDATPVDKATSASMVNLFGKLPWLECGAYRSDIARRSVLPGSQAYASARDTSDALRAVATGRVLSPSTLAEALQSRRVAPTADPLSLPAKQPRLFKLFEKAEFGLGVQIGVAESAGVTSAPPGGQQSWGHLGSNGSFALVLPGSADLGTRPIVATLLLNLDQHGPSGEPGVTQDEFVSDGLHTCRTVLRAVVDAHARDTEHARHHAD